MSVQFSPRFLCRLTAFTDLLQPWDVRGLYIRKTARFSSPTLGRHISTFRGYQILFSIRNPLIYKSDLLQPWDVRRLYIRKTARFSSSTLGRHISTFRGYQILFSIRNPLIYKSLHQSFFYSFITILPSESAVLYSTVIFLNHNIIILESGSFLPVKWVDSPHLIAIIL